MELKISVVYLIVLMSVLIICGCSEKEEPLIATIGKDTKEYYGRGLYQIVKVVDVFKFVISGNKDSSSLTIEEEVLNYVEIDKKVYILGADGYTILYVNEEQIKHLQVRVRTRVNPPYYWEWDQLKKRNIKYSELKDFNEFSPEEQKVFKGLTVK